MRDILFRGQTMRAGEKVRMDGEKLPGNWVYGGIFPGAGDFSIIYGCNDVALTVGNLERHVVYSDTVGEYTGRTDSNVLEIFEDDIIRELSWGTIGVIRYGEYQNPFNNSIASCHIGFYVDWVSGENKDMLQKCLGYWSNRVEIIGNVHDNPEILKGGAD